MQQTKKKMLLAKRIFFLNKMRPSPVFAVKNVFGVSEHRAHAMRVVA